MTDNKKIDSYSCLIIDRAITRLKTGYKEYRFDIEKLFITVDHALQLLEAAKAHRCGWYMPEDWDDSYWATTCGNEMNFTEGTPKESGYKYCTFCGEKIKYLEKEQQEENHI